MDCKIKQFLLFLFLFVSTPCFASTWTQSTTYATNGQVTAQNLNGNLQGIGSVINGGLDNDNANTTSGYRFFEVKSSLPSFGSQGRVVLLTSDNSLNLDTGSSWVKFQTGGILMPSGCVFFMASGSCPSGSTDVSSSYSNKFLKINATAGTSSGVIFTATTDSHTLDTSEIPSHTHTTTFYDTGGSFSTSGQILAQNATARVVTSSATGGGGGHTHTISSATTLEPASVTMKACKVD